MDFALCRNYVLPAPWFELNESSGFRLFVNPETGRNAEWCATDDRFALAYGMTRELHAMTVWHAQGAKFKTLSDAIGGAVAGVMIDSQGIVVFRDKLGLIPIVIIRSVDQRKMVITTSPDLTTTLTQGRQMNRRWLAHYLSGRWNDDVEDMMSGVSRLLPGELLCIRTGCVTRHKYWPKSSFFSPICVESMDEAVEKLRQSLIAAVKRIPNDRMSVYTLSGGLDSGGIVGITCAQRLSAGQRLHAVSLISEKYPSCDESREIGIMAKALPVDVHYINMDDIKPLSEVELYRLNAFGPTIAAGLETTLALFRYVAKKWPGAQLVTGYGGNYLVDTSAWTQFHDFTVRGDVANLYRLVKTFDINTLCQLAKYQFAGMCDGKLRLAVKAYMPWPLKYFVFESERPSELGKRWLTPVVEEYAAGGAPLRSQAEERLYAICSWNNELRMRALDKLVRATQVEYYDPLFDPELYETCARLPASLYEQSRRGYRQALAPFLPSEIIHHAKIQNFDEVSRFDRNQEAMTFVDEALHANTDRGLDAFIRSSDLKKAWGNYPYAMMHPENLSYDTRDLLWRSISLFF